MFIFDLLLFSLYIMEILYTNREKIFVYLIFGIKSYSISAVKMTTFAIMMESLQLQDDEFLRKGIHHKLYNF